MRDFQFFIKRAFDIVLSLVMILMLTVIPVLLIIPIVIRLTSKGPAVFTQDRAGKDGKTFKIYKFRTMLIPEESFDKDGNPMESKQRITKVGRILRKTSLDELMQLFNVLNGTMSFVGPRPTLPYQIERYDERQKKRLLMRPGVTGWAQVNGRNELTWTEKIEFDVEYVEKFSLWFDIKILFRTVGVVLGQKGVAFTKPDAAINKGAGTPEKDEKKGERKMKALVLAGTWSQIVLLKQLRERNIETVLADNNPQAIAIPYADKFVRANILDAEAVRKIAVDEKVDFLITVCADQVLITVAKVSEELGLPCYIDHETACKVSDKGHMKDIFSQNGIPTSKHVFMAELNMETISDMTFPLVVKPVDAYSSKGVRKATNEEELRQYFQEAATISRSGVVIVEEYVEGAELTVDFQVIDGKAHLLSASNTEKVNYKDRFLAFRTRYPAAVSPETLERVAEIGQKIATAFGLKNAPMLVQLLTDDKKESVLEFCARTGGGAKYLLLKAATGFDPITAVIDLTLGNPVSLQGCTPESAYVTNEFLYAAPGVIDHLEGFEELKKDGVIAEYWFFKWKGAQVLNALTSSDRVVSVTIHSDSYEDLVEKHNRIASAVKIIDENGNDIMRHDLLTDIQPLFIQ